MEEINIKFRDLPILISRGEMNAACGRFRHWVASDSYSYGLRRDLAISIQTPPAKIFIKVRPFGPTDISLLFAGKKQGSGFFEKGADLKRLLDAGIEQGYVATSKGGVPCHVQWLILPKENEKVQRSLGGLLPWLGQDEALLEQAFTMEPFRGLGIMAHVMAQVAELGRQQGARWALAFVDEDNTAALKGYQKAGFRPYLIRRESWRLFQCRVSFHLLPRGTPFPYDQSQRAAPPDRLSMAG